MTDQENTAGSGLEQAASDNNPAAPEGERPSTGAQRRTDPAEPNPAANQRSGETDVAQTGGVREPDADAVSTQSTGAAQAEPQRHRADSSAGSSAAAAGEVPVVPVEKTQDDAAGETDAATHERPVTGVHRPSAPSGEVSPR
ncbi:MAG: hypothetical protein QOF82_2005 [Frankiales bacterium]|jgi:hypothetical protein|nr:hypothetical protein [Frankiales bacterium]